MAYDKVVDSAVLEAGLTKIAEAIREKGGTTDTLAFPDAMAAAIAAIEAGGGVDVSPWEDAAFATLIPASDLTETVDFSTYLGKTSAPGLFAIGQREGVTKSNAVEAAVYFSPWNEVKILRYKGGTKRTDLPNEMGDAKVNFGSYLLEAGVTYWIGALYI